MGTTADKLKYLNDTKTKIKNALETTSTVMRDYPDMIKKYIDNQPTRIVSDGICSNAVDLPAKAIRIDGNSKQETRDGNNFFDASKISNTTISVLDKGKTIKMPIDTKGNGYTGTGVNLSKVCPKLKVGDTVYLLGNTTSSANHYIYLAGSNYLWQFDAARTITQDDLNSTVVLYGNRFQDGETEQVTISNLRVAKNKSDEWEQYGVSPSIDYPQKVEVINDGQISLEQSGKNWFNESYYSDKTLYKTPSIYFASIEMPDSFKTKFYGNGFLKGVSTNLVVGFSESNGSIPGDKRILSQEKLNANVEYDFTNADKVYFMVGNGNRINKDTDIDTIFNNYNIMVTTTEDNSYEPYHEHKIIPIDLNVNTLSKVGDIKDKLKIYRNGEVEIEKRIGKVLLDGSESWNNVYSKIYNNMCLYDTAIVSDIIDKKGILCSNNFTYNNTFNENVGEVIALRSSGNIGIALNSSRCPNYTAAEAKTYLSQHPTEVYYQLATPQIIKLPSIPPIELWQGTNIFKLITNLDTDFEVEYVVDKDSVTKEEE